MQSKEELEQWYEKEDPWGYKTNPDDLNRKSRILRVLNKNVYNKALDVGMGEGWVTCELPAKEIYGIELSDEACKRLPSNITRINKPEGIYDLVVATGVLYSQYDNKQMIEWIENYSSKHILIAGIKDWLIPHNFGHLIYNEEFKYRDMKQIIKLYEK